MEFARFQPSLKDLLPFLQISRDHDASDYVIAYWSRLYATEVMLNNTTKSPEAMQLLMILMYEMEEIKNAHGTKETIAVRTAAKAYMENHVLNLFANADKQDREGKFNTNIVKTFTNCGVLYDVLQTFGDLTDEMVHNRKYSKWKAAHIDNCLKNGKTPVPGPKKFEEEMRAEAIAARYETAM
ncbi:vacuolar protein sorting-associated protein VTA1 homolog [Teleopsis dalmanni]|uniref:vacuolar protein sorting-associated protein VTA1 homolog n=1 Tax=Teleopsis dalmanni TaxID=139649 RepID=UPI0018CFC2AA|nr:vacuolar protein sorting-associated protein VTA1 homolog [Teleopsis dalmanni]XP_037939539.1 vacuolar protein sorting-associated protein VTA1 homolog [Teleopsis dalmanni]